ncbi:hypothetical protein [Streptobacillus moniliformis]|uniref:hypothetical protein n=1 Tax=Streptobacillus moniliformis TaxID=34105 RepID=UPI0007E435ED|nr:hypothetical protein [Streptobacillus moniliformis]
MENSFSSNKKYHKNKMTISRSDSKNKKEETGTLNSSKITGPRYRLEGALGINTIKSPDFFQAIAILPEWKSQISQKFDITFGPKLTLFLSETKSAEKLIVRGNAVLGIESNFNFRVKENIKVYIGLEAGVGGGIKKNVNDAVEKDVSLIIKAALGSKINDKYNIAIYSAIPDKGLVGIEFGYTFK